MIEKMRDTLWYYLNIGGGIMADRIYVLVAYTKDGRIFDLGYSTSREEVRKSINSKEVQEQLKELKIKDCQFKIRDNYYPTNFYDLE